MKTAALLAWLSLWLWRLSLRCVGAVDTQLTEVQGQISVHVESMPQQPTWTWVIEPPRCNRVYLVFERLSIGSAELHVSVVRDSQLHAIFSCVDPSSCLNIPPAPFYGTSGSVHVRLTFNSNAVNFRTTRFVLHYIGLFESVEAAERRWENFTLPLRMPYAKIEPTLVGGLFPPWARMQWSVDVVEYYANDVSSNAPVSGLTFSIAELVLPEDCSVVVEIYDGAAQVHDETARLFSGCTSSDFIDRWLYTTAEATVVMYSRSNSYQPATIQLAYTSSGAMQNCGFIASPERVVASTMRLVDGSGHSNKMRSGQRCSWLIQPVAEAVQSITLLMTSVSIHPDASLTVSDGTSSSSKTLWNCQGCQFVVPPPLRSTTGAMYLQFTSSSRSSSAYRGFAAEYSIHHSGSHGTGSGVDKLYMSTAFGIRPPGDRLVYSSELRQSWRIQPSTKSAIHLSIYQLDIQDCDDYLAVYDGSDADAPLLKTLSCGATNPRWIISSGTSLFLEFVSDADDDVAGGFEFSFYADGPNYQCGLSSSPMIIRDPSMIISDGSSASEKMYDSQSCQWIIDPGEGFSGLTLYFTSFDLLGGQISVSYEGKTVHISASGVIPPPVVLSGRKATITYTSQSVVSGYGFQAEYFAVHANQSGPGDSVIELYASSMLDLKLPVTPANTYPASWSVSWLIAPQLEPGTPIYLSFAGLYLPDCNDTLTVYDGDSTRAPVIAEFCGTTLPTAWLQSSGPALYLEFNSDGDRNTGNFSLAYASDGPNFHCGFLHNPGVFTAPSMVISDGSSSSSSGGGMLADQHCEFWLQPLGATHVALHVEFVDMRGGSLQVYERHRHGGDRMPGGLLWECAGCETPPPSLLARGSMKVVFRSSSAPIGQGFRAFYASLQELASPEDTQEAKYALLSPQAEQFADVGAQNSSAWYMPTTADVRSIIFQPEVFVVNTTASSAGWKVIDGRPSELLQQVHGPARRTTHGFCGFVGGAQNASSPTSLAMLRLPNANLTAASRQDTFVVGQPRPPGTVVGSLELAATSSESHNAAGNDSSTAPYLVSTDQHCRYVLEAQDDQAIVITLQGRMPEGIQVQIYGGLDAFSTLLFGSTAEVMWGPSGSSKNRTADSAVVVVAPCGRAAVEITTIDTHQGQPTALSLDITYSLDPSDAGRQKCAAYRQSLLPDNDPPPDFWSQFRLLLIGCAALGVVLLLCLCNNVHCKRAMRTLQRIRQKYLPVMYADYPRYTPVIDYCRNRMLPEGQCVICSAGAQSIRLECSHFICLADMKSYIQTALGDVSLFPVRCPMHFDGCKGVIGAEVAKRVLDKARYMKFLEFHDRCTFGEGMRCIFCCKFVNFPAVMYVSMVECPYCTQRFCLRCKKAWHVNATKCPMDRDDEALESWRVKRGAQKCPGCMKIIEKEDSSTCNHMVHKSTDAIPCLRERTDFCYLCGIEVLPDYPHDEVPNLGVNHFPAGVFQDCRTIIEREQERARRRKKYRRSQWMGSASVVPIDTFDPQDSYRPQSAPQALESEYRSSSFLLQPTELSPMSYQPQRAFV